MKNTPSPSPSIFGHTAPAPRLTKSGAALIAFAAALPVGCILWIVEWLWL